MTESTKDGFDGILLIDKPPKMTSFQVVKRVRKLVRPHKVGHTGTLDPLATGLLPITIGEATKLANWLQGPKRYRALIRLGSATDTLDAQGQVLSTRPVPAFGRASLERVLDCFRGVIEQTPPMYSAIHHQGQRLYQLARQGIEVERKKRTVEIHSIQINDLSAETISLDICCSPGTYIRTLAADIAQSLGTVAHLQNLVRLASNGFDLQQAVALEGLGQGPIRDHLIKIPDVLQRYKEIQVPTQTNDRLVCGDRLGHQELALLLNTSCQPGPVWFTSKERESIVLAAITQEAGLLSMKTLRVLHPPAQPKKH